MYAYIYYNTGVDCGVLPAVEFGSIVYLTNTTTYLSEAEYRCDSGYTRVGTDIRTCQASRIWSESAPTCERGLCILVHVHACGYVYYSVHGKPR